MRLGLEQDGWVGAFANDIAPEKRRMYADHFPDEESILVLGDVHELDTRIIPPVTLATASFPCNDLSVAGMRRGLSGKQSSAFWGFIRILDEMGDRRPPLVLLENVAGFLTSHGGRDFEEALLALNKLGYAVDAMVINAACFVPQSRVRLFVVGSLDPGCPNWRIGETLAFYESDVRPASLASFILEHPGIRWRTRPVPQLPRGAPDLRDVLEDLPDDSPHWWNDTRRDYLAGQMSSKHSAQLQAMISADAWSYGTVFRRVRKGRSMAELRTDGIAGCLRTPRGGSGRQILVKAGKGKLMVRLLTPRECARLMGADDFTINVSLNQALFGFGDAVCVPVIAWLAKNYLSPLLDEMRTRANSEAA